ncbi:MAG: potassium-transporting ATPase subunit B [Crenarchaeota archaeon 13_1_40CM_3_52_4]|nr:MAG: potassium-transporting ATPase subunit B [Crenarchaeota archaeon 13_1_40CM_3_52_4]
MDSLVRLNPASLIANPVMFIVELTFFIVAAMAIYPPAFYPVANWGLRIYYFEVALILLITVWFSTLADALAETQAKNTASSLRSLESEVQSKKIVTEGEVRKIMSTPSTALRKGDLILLEKNDVVPIDAEVLEGIGMVDESLLTGESIPVRKAPGDEVIGGSKVISDTLTARVTVNPEDTYISEMIRLVESSKRPRTPNEVAVTMVLIGLTAIFTIIVVALLGLSITLNLATDLSVLLSLYVCLLPTTIGALLPSIGLSGISRLYRRKIVAKSGRAVERAGDTDVIILDKTGTITVGNRQAVEFVPFEGHTEKEVGEAAFLSSWHDDTPEGRSLIRLAYEDGFVPRELNALAVSEVYEFSASTRTSGVKISQGTGFMLPKGDKSGRERGRLRRKFEAYQEAGSVIAEDETEIIKGAPDAIKKIARSIPSNFDVLVDKISSQGDTPLALTRNREAIGIIRLKDVLKPGIKEKILSVKVMGIRPVMLTGDQPLTAKSIASEVGIDEYRPEAKPEDKYDIVMKEQAETRVVAMIGDGTNDAPALAVADIGLAMNSGTQAAKEAANMVDLESNPAKIIEVVMLGKQLLMTRGAVTTFSIANDVAKYFAIVPVMFAVTLPELKALNILGLGLNTAVLSALIFNAVIIPLLIPLAMRGIRFKPTSTMSLFIKNAIIYGAGGIIVPFIGIRLIDIALLSIGA